MFAIAIDRTQSGLRAPDRCAWSSLATVRLHAVKASALRNARAVESPVA